MKKSAYIVLAVITLFVFSCNKNQKVVKQLDGSWKQTGSKLNGVAEPDSTFAGTTYTFEKCKVKKGDCNGTISADGKSIPFTYNVTEDGTKFTMKLTFFGTTESSTGDIVEHSKSKFVFKTTEGGDTYETTLEKQ